MPYTSQPSEQPNRASDTSKSYVAESTTQTQPGSSGGAANPAGANPTGGYGYGGTAGLHWGPQSNVRPEWKPKSVEYSPTEVKPKTYRQVGVGETDTFNTLDSNSPFVESERVKAYEAGSGYRAERSLINKEYNKTRAKVLRKTDKQKDKDDTEDDAKSNVWSPMSIGKILSAVQVSGGEEPAKSGMQFERGDTPGVQYIPSRVEDMRQKQYQTLKKQQLASEKRSNQNEMTTARTTSAVVTTICFVINPVLGLIAAGVSWYVLGNMDRANKQSESDLRQSMTAGSALQRFSGHYELIDKEVEDSKDDTYYV